jgi:hypothetical protein
MYKGLAPQSLCSNGVEATLAFNMHHVSCDLKQHMPGRSLWFLTCKAKLPASFYFQTLTFLPTVVNSFFQDFLGDGRVHLQLEKKLSHQNK